MNARKKRISALLIGSGLALIGLVASLGIGAFGTPAKAAPLAGCTSVVHYDAYDAATGSNRFGPTNASDHSLATATKRFDVKLCQDPLYAATMVAFEQDGLNLDPNKVEAQAAVYVKDRSKWLQAVLAVKADVATYTTEYKPASYETLAMVVGKNRSVMPTLHKFPTSVTLGWVMALKLKNGDIRDLRIICDLQPSVPHFPKVTPPPAHKPPPSPTPTPSASPTCKYFANPYGAGYSWSWTKCDWYKPAQSKDCMLNGSWTQGCPPNQADQPVQSNPGQYTGPTVGAPTTAPPYEPPTTNPTSGPAPSPNSSGYNSGGGAGSAPGGTTCDSSGCTSTSPSPTTSPSPNPGNAGATQSAMPSSPPA